MGTARAESFDVCILGAGLAALTLARQLRQKKPELNIALVEHRQFPVPQAIHKVGESTVEIAAHYLAETLALKPHLEAEQLPKFGLRLFVRGEVPIQDDLAAYDEIGVSRLLPIPTFQVDRGRLENHLAQTLVDDGVVLLGGSTVRQVDVGHGRHKVVVRDGQSERHLQSRYLVDCSGRRAWLRNQLGLTRKVRHANHALWFRVEGQLDLDSWSSNQTWQARCHGKPRRLSTNHFTGPGYWLWLIPLASDVTSVGLVFDPSLVPVDQVDKHDKIMRWLQHEHPLIARHLSEREPLDFHVLKDYAVGSRQLYAEQGWMLNGDAGMFADPFYSPGADFIAFGNGFISELITRELGADSYQKFQSYFQAFFSNTLSLYRGQYAGFGQRDLMVMKTLWDYSYYWGPLAKLFFTGRFTDIEFMDQAHDALYRASALNSGMQSKFRAMSRSAGRVGGAGKFFDHHEIPLFHRMKNELLEGDSEDAGRQLNQSADTLETIAGTLRELMQQLEAGGEIPDLHGLGQRPGFA